MQVDQLEWKKNILGKELVIVQMLFMIHMLNLIIKTFHQPVTIKLINNKWVLKVLHSISKQTIFQNQSVLTLIKEVQAQNSIDK